MKDIITYTLLLLLSLMMVVGVAYQEKVNILQEDDLKSVSCGWPLDFMISDQSWRNPPLPWQANCFAGEWGSHPTIIWSALIMDTLLFYLGLVILRLVYRFGLKSRRT